MIRRLGKNLGLYVGAAPAAAEALERDGYAVLEAVFTPEEVAGLAAEIEAVFDALPPDPRMRDDRAEFRYEMLNRSALAQQAVGHPRILEAIEPLLGEDCHVIANSAWRNPPTFGGGPWHCDAGPHVPRPEGVPWDDRIPYPVFAIGAHLYLWDCPEPCGPTAVVPGSHRSGRLAPRDRVDDPDLDYEGRSPVLLEARAGDVALFVSDAWHRGTPAGPGGAGRFFLQCHYARRDIAQRLRTSDVVHQLSPEAVARAIDERQRTLVGLHPAYFYDG
jgi:ectoine hydroxylase-related dioxygenase (phytanoyl-CoA dioxygenase family)